jgi:hypothetical protein
MFRSLNNNFLNIRLRNISDSNQAVVGIVVAVLLIGLIVTVLSVIQLIYVPNWMEEIESEHIDEVFNQFSQLKLVIDTQTAINITSTPIVTSITLGTNKIPFFMSTQAAGALDIINNASYVSFGHIINETTGELKFYNFPLGSIRYSSVNAYYIPEEQISFVYENGALITDQRTDSSLNIKPSIEYDENTGGINGTLYFNIVNILGIGGKISKYGYDTDHIRTELHHNYFYYNESLNYLNITTNYPNIWKPLINSTLNDLDYGLDYIYINTLNNKKISIEFINKKPNIQLKYTIIYAQIGPGWIDIE